MGRQMFAKGGAAFPDLSGDGNVTQKDILMGRGVIPMQDGGMAPMPMAAAPGPQMMPPGLPPIDPGSVDINEAAQGAMQQGINPAELEGMLTQYASQMDDLENAEDYETVINGIRGDTAPIEQRYQELAQVVGPEDSQATPESVLTLLQPVMQIAAVDQGIGGLAAEEMSAPVEGAMAEGIMSTVNMGAPEAPVQVPGGPAPVNFNQGGAVQYMNVGGAADPSRMQTLYNEQLALMNQIDDPAVREAALAERKDMTQAGILFDIAQGALSFAGGGGRPGASPAEQLASAFTPVVGNIGARAGDLSKFKDSQTAQDRQLRLGAMQGAQQAYQGELTRAAAAANVKPGETFQVKDADGTLLWQGPIGTVGAQQKIMAQYPDAVSITEITDPKAPEYITFIDPNNLSNFHVFNKNDMSTDNQSKMELIRQSVNAEGQPMYRITGAFTPSKDSGSAASVQNFILKSTGETETVDLSTPEGQARKTALIDLGYVKGGVADVDGDSTTAKLQVIVNRDDPTDQKTFDMNDPDQRASANELLKGRYLPTTVPSYADAVAGAELGNDRESKFIKLTANPGTLAAYADGTLDAETANIINGFITQNTRQKAVVDTTTGQATLVAGYKLPPVLINAIIARGKIEGATLPSTEGVDVLNITNAEVSPDETDTGRIKFLPDGTIDYSTFEDDNTFLVTGIDLTKSQTWRSTMDRFFNQVAGQLKIGDGYAGDSGKITSQADTQLNALATQINRIARKGIDGKVFAMDVASVEEQTAKFRPGGSKTDVNARDQLVTVRNTLAAMYGDAYTIASNPKSYPTGNKLKDAETLLPQIERYLAETTAAIAVYDRFLTTDPIADAVRDRSVTSTLKRANDGDD